MKFERRLISILLPISLASLANCSTSESKKTGDHSDSISPYIDSIREGLKPEADRPIENPQPYIDSLKPTLKSDDTTDYSERLKSSLAPEEKPSENYSQIEAAKLAPEAEGGAIDAVIEGRSELHAKRVGAIHNAFGLRVGAALNRAITASPDVANNFQNIYGTAYRPDVTFFYEWKPFHSETWGSLGIVPMLGLTYFDGFGTFQIPNLTYGTVPTVGGAGGSVGTTSSTKFQFFLLPITVAAQYHFNLAKYVRPYVNTGPSAIIYDEIRSDNVRGNKGYSFGVMSSVGVSILMDWVSGQSTWDLYSQYSIKHYYINVEYTNLSTFNGDVNVATNGVFAGISFEY